MCFFLLKTFQYYECWLTDWHTNLFSFWNLNNVRPTFFFVLCGMWTPRPIYIYKKKNKIKILTPLSLPLFAVVSRNIHYENAKENKTPVNNFTKHSCLIFLTVYRTPQHCQPPDLLTLTTHWRYTLKSPPSRRLPRSYACTQVRDVAHTFTLVSQFEKLYLFLIKFFKNT